MTEGNIFSMSTLARGYPIPGLDGGVPHPADGDTPTQVWMGGVPHARSGWGRGYPIPCLDGVPHPTDGVPPSKIRMGYPHQNLMGYLHPGLDGVPPSKTGWGTPPVQDWMGYSSCPRLDGVPPPQSGDRSAKWALATQWAVCILHSRRRTF